MTDGQTDSLTFLSLFQLGLTPTHVCSGQSQEMMTTTTDVHDYYIQIVTTDDEIKFSQTRNPMVAATTLDSLSGRDFETFWGRL